LLRTLQEKEFERLGSTQTKKVDVRLIAASNRDLEKMISTREFRSDLYYRLSVFPIHVPALRERREDIPLLVRYFVQRFARQMQKRIETIPGTAMKALTNWDWPGNIRELENFMERAVILTRGSVLEAPLAELKRERQDTATGTHNRKEIAAIVSDVITRLDRQETHNGASQQLEKQRERIIEALKQAKGRVGGKGGAAEQVGVNRTTLLGRMKRLGIWAEQFR
jgi:formate hydrogenlyase transcriptional activator